MKVTDTLLLAVTEDYYVQIGSPPRNPQDRFMERAISVGKVNNISQLACSPDGELFCIRGGDLYRGPLPSKKDVDWFTVAQRVGRSEWNRFKRILFHPNGDLYVTTNDGEFYKGPQPDNENVSWLSSKAKRIGDRVWIEFNILFFDIEGQLYGVASDKFYRGAPPTEENASWAPTLLGESDWERFTYFMGYTPDNMLWAVDKYNGNLFRGDTPTPQRPDYLGYAEYLGWGYNECRFLAFTKDRKIQKIISLEFLTDQGEKLSETPEMLEEKIYDNRKGRSTLRDTFTINKTVKVSSSFTQEHGFTFEDGREITYKSGIPCITEGSVSAKLNTSTTYNWNFTGTNETEVCFQLSKTVEVEPGCAIRMVASALKVEIIVPYKARACTMFGSEVVVNGKWNGVLYGNLMVTQEDYK